MEKEKKELEERLKRMKEKIADKTDEEVYYNLQRNKDKKLI